MPNKPRQEKRICAQCGVRTRRWVQNKEDQTITCQSCAHTILTMTSETPQAGAGEERRDSASGKATPKCVFRGKPQNEVRLGTVEQEFHIPLTPHEISAKGAQLSGAVNDISQIEAEKKRTKREFCARLKAARQNMNSLAQAVATGTVPEIRQAEVFLDRSAQRVNYRAPGTGALYHSRDLEPGEQFQLPMEGGNNA